MNPDKCSFCKGKLVKGNAEFVVKVKDEMLVIKDISAFVCSECGEAYYSPEESGKSIRL